MTRCRDAACPLRASCQRFDDAPVEDKFASYFTRSPRQRDTCDYFAPIGQAVNPLTQSEWPKDPDA